jgi:hypothetical protein
MEIAFVIILTLCVVTILPWMIKKDFEERMLASLRREITHNIEQLREYNREDRGHSHTAQGRDQIDGLILKDAVFRRIQQMDFRSKGLTDEDKELLEKVFATSSQMVLSAPDRDAHKRCADNMKILEDMLSRLTAYGKA